MRLPARLVATAQLVPPLAASVADVGSGHGALALWLASRGARVVATERTARSFALLQRDLARQAGAGDPAAAVEARHGDGLEPFAPGEVEVVVIAGMGGRSIIRILERAPWWPQWLVLQPIQDPHLVSAWLGERGWPAREARMTQSGRWYLGWLVEVPGGEPRRVD